MQTVPAPASKALERASRIAVWTWSVDEDLVTGNDELAEIFGLPADDVRQGLPLWTFIEHIHPDDRQSVVELIAESLGAGSVYSTQYRISDGADDVYVHAVGRCYAAGDDGAGKVHVGLVINLSSFMADAAANPSAFSALDQIAYHCLVAHKLSKAHGFDSLAKTLHFVLEEVGTRIAQQIT